MHLVWNISFKLQSVIYDNIEPLIQYSMQNTFEWKILVNYSKLMSKNLHKIIEWREWGNRVCE